MQSAGFEPAIAATKRAQDYAFGRLGFTIYIFHRVLSRRRENTNCGDSLSEKRLIISE